MTDAIGEAILAELQKLTKLLTPDARAIPNHPMTVKEFADVVGKSTKTVHRWIANRKLIAKREGHTVLITPIAARKFLGDGSLG